MGQLLAAEHLKMKRTMMMKLLVFAPIVTLGISILSGAYFYSCAFNWWYTMFYPVVLAIICNQIQEKEKKKLDYRNIYMSPVSFYKIWVAKSILAVGYSMFVCVFLAVIIIAITMVTGVTMKMGIGAALLAGCVISLSCIYQIPIYFYLAKRFNFLVTFLFGIVFVALGIFYTEKSYWFLVPPAWCNRSMYPILRILLNGLFMEKEQEYLLVSNSSIAACVCASVFLFAIGTVLVGWIMKREVERK